jgi:TonB-dependent receptor
MRLNFYYKNRGGYVFQILVFFSLFLQSFAFAQTAIIRGQVTDITTNDALVGANVLVKGTNLGAAADIDGNFVIHNVSVGSQVLVVSYIGYKNLNVKIDVIAGKTNEINIKLEAVALEGKTIVVTAQAKGQLQAINQQLSSNNIVNIVSSEKMQELPDANIAESIGRLPGISIQRNAGEADKVVVRGLSPQFNLVTIEGIPMSSTSFQSLNDLNKGSFSQDRGVDLSLLSDNMVQGVELSKTLRPDMDPTVLGGTINLTLRTAPSGLHYSLGGNGAYNHLRDSYNNYKFLASVSNRFIDDKVGVLLLGNIEEKQLPSDQFNATYSSAPIFNSTTNQFYYTSSSAELTDNTTQRQRYGVTLILDYTGDLVDVKSFNVYDAKIDSSITRDFTNNYGNNSFLDQIFLSKTKTEQETHSIQALFKIAGTELPVSLSYTKGTQKRPNGEQFDFLESGVGNPLSASSLIYGQPASLVKAHGVQDPNNTAINNLYLSNTSLTDEAYDARVDWKVPFNLSDDFSGKLSVGGMYHQVHRDSYNNRIYYNVQYGGSILRRKNLIAAIPFFNGLDPNNSSGIPAYTVVDPGYGRSSILGYPIGVSYDVSKMAFVMNTIYPAWRNIFYDDGPEDYELNYTDKEKSMAGYFMGEFNIGKDITAVAGVRWQQEQTDIAAFHVQINGSNQNGLAGQLPILVDSKRDNPNWYPSLNVKYKATDNIQILGAVYKSATLPSYTDISPLVLYEANQTIVTGNPYLKPSTAWNLDLGGSLFNNEIGLFTVNFFYKDITDLIYGMQNYYPFSPYPLAGTPSDIYTRLPGKGYFDTSWANANNGKQIKVSIPMNDPAHAYLRGIELSWQTHLWYLPGLLSGIVLDLNASFMSSNQMYPSFQVVGPKVGNKDTLLYSTVAGSLQDQPKAIYNAVIGWDFKGFSARLSASYQKSSLSSIDTRYGLQNNYTDTIYLLDIALKQQIMDNFAVFANATNINNHIDNKYFLHPEYNSATVTYPAGQLPTNEETYSWNAQFGISYNF